MPICNWNHSEHTSLRCLVSLLLCRGVPQLRPQGVDPRALPLSRLLCRKRAPILFLPRFRAEFVLQNYHPFDNSARRLDFLVDSDFDVPGVEFQDLFAFPQISEIVPGGLGDGAPQGHSGGSGGGAPQ